MSTIQVEEKVKKQLFSIAAELQSRRGMRVSLNEAIKHLISIYYSGKRDIPRALSLFACLRSEPEARHLLKKLRLREEERLERKCRV